MNRLFRKVGSFVALFLVVVMLLTLMPAGTVFAANPTVTMNVTAGMISINNTVSIWALGYATPNEVIYFSATGAADPDYSLMGNNGNMPVDIAIQGVDFGGTPISWVLATAAGKDQYALAADAAEAGTYAIEVKKTAYVDIATNLLPGTTLKWSARFTAPNEFDATEVGDVKTATMTLVAREHT